MSNKEAIIKVLAEQTRSEQDETKKVLDVLRRTRAARGGTGAPLEVPAHLRNPITMTDDDVERR